MYKIREGNFYNPTRGYLSSEETMEEMIHYMEEKPEKFYDIIVGCDKKNKISIPDE